MEEYKQWFFEQSPRDQMVLVFGVITVVFYILFFVVLFPMQDGVSKKERQINDALVEQGDIYELASKLKARQDTGASGASDQSLNSVINATTRQFGVSMMSNQPSGNSARVRLGPSQFNNVISWLHEMEINRGIQIKDLTITADTVPGNVTTQLQLVKGG